jgi:hypothetical protein
LAGDYRSIRTLRLVFVGRLGQCLLDRLVVPGLLLLEAGQRGVDGGGRDPGHGLAQLRPVPAQAHVDVDDLGVQGVLRARGVLPQPAQRRHALRYTGQVHRLGLLRAVCLLDPRHRHRP